MHVANYFRCHLEVIISLLLLLINHLINIYFLLNLITQMTVSWYSPISHCVCVFSDFERDIVSILNVMWLYFFRLCDRSMEFREAPWIPVCCYPRVSTPRGCPGRLYTCTYKHVADGPPRLEAYSKNQPTPATAAAALLKCNVFCNQPATPSRAQSQRWRAETEPCLGCGRSTVEWGGGI